MNLRRGPFRPTTAKLAAVQPSSSTRSKTLIHALTKVTGDPTKAIEIVEDALGDFGATEVPDEEPLFAVFVRGYVVSRALATASMASVEAMLAKVLR